MFTIKNYTDTICELEMAKARLRLLTEKKEALYCKYFPMTANITDETVKSRKQDDKMLNYLSELYELDIGTGKSLADEILYQQHNIDRLKKCIKDMNDTLSKMTGIEYKLYYEIVVKGVGISKAVENIAEYANKEPRTIWKNYYSKIKKDVKKVARFSFENN